MAANRYLTCHKTVVTGCADLKTKCSHTVQTTSEYLDSCLQKLSPICFFLLEHSSVSRCALPFSVCVSSLRRMNTLSVIELADGPHNTGEKGWRGSDALRLWKIPFQIIRHRLRALPDLPLTGRPQPSISPGSPQCLLLFSLLPALGI